MTKPKILFFITKSNWGGAQKYVFDLATDKLVLENFLAKVVLGGNGELADKLKIQNIEVLFSKHLTNSLNPIKLIFSIFENIKIILNEKPDIVHTNSSFAGIAIGTACFILRQKSIFTVHGWPQNEDRNVLVKTILKITMWFVVFFHTKTIAVSKKNQEQTPSFLNLKNKVVVIYNGIGEIDFQNFNQIKILNKNVVNLVTIAEINKNKNYQFILEALSLLPENLNWNYYIIGSGSDEKQLSEKIIKHKFKEKIIFVGFVKDAKKYLTSFDIFLLGSLTESFAYVLLEAGLSKLPVICTNVGGLPEIVEDNKTGFLVNLKDVSTFSEKIKLLIENIDLRKKFGESLHEKVSTNFASEKMIEETLGLYKRLCSFTRN